MQRSVIRDVRCAPPPDFGFAGIRATGPAADYVAQSVEQISQMLEEMASSVNAADGNVQSLEHLAEQLRDSVARFHL